MKYLVLFLTALSLCGQTAVEPKPQVLEVGSPDAETGAELAKVRRVYVDLLTGGEGALKIRDLLITSLQASKLFVVTEVEQRADAFLRGTGQDTAFNETFQSSEGINAHSQISIPDSNSSSNSRYGGHTTAGMTIGENDSRRIEERKHEAIATVRLVDKDGDVIWSTTQESFGGKFLGAAADVADKVAKKLALDVRRARDTYVNPPSPAKPATESKQ